MRLDKPIYNVNWQRLATWLLPVVLRRPLVMAWVQALVKPIVDVYLNFLTLKNATAYDLGITPQVCFLEKMLNDRWDPSQRRINIVKPVVKNPVVLYLKSESKKQSLYLKSENKPWITYKKNESEAFVVDFIVEVPADVIFDVFEMSARLENKILPSKIFDIKIV